MTEKNNNPENQISYYCNRCKEYVPTTHLHQFPQPVATLEASFETFFSRGRNSVKKDKDGCYTIN